MFELAAIACGALASVSQADGSGLLAESGAALERLSAEQLATRLLAHGEIAAARGRHGLGGGDYGNRPERRAARP